MGVIQSNRNWENYILHNFGVKIGKEIPEWIVSIICVEDELYLTVESQYLKEVLLYLRDRSEFQFKQLMDIAGADYPSRLKRFELNYVLLSLFLNIRVQIKVCLAEFEQIDSVTDVFSSAGWLEREIWDLFGIFFYGHKDLRRILTDYGFEGFPLRKDFPLTGFTEVRYDDEKRSIVYEPLEVAQEFRYFDFGSPWEFRS